jgi:hypothetical protein
MVYLHFFQDKYILEGSSTSKAKGPISGPQQGSIPKISKSVKIYTTFGSMTMAEPILIISFQIWVIASAASRIIG